MVIVSVLSGLLVIDSIAMPGNDLVSPRYCRLDRQSRPSVSAAGD